MGFAAFQAGLLMGLMCAPLMYPGEPKNDFYLLVAHDNVADVVHATHDVLGRNAFYSFEFPTGGQPARRS
jgi:hypothetical protein